MQHHHFAAVESTLHCREANRNQFSSLLHKYANYTANQRQSVFQAVVYRKRCLSTGQAPPPLVNLTIVGSCEPLKEVRRTRPPHRPEDQQSAASTQNNNLRANCICRGVMLPAVDEMIPKVGVVRPAPGSPKVGVFVMLKNSARNWALNRSVTETFLSIDKLRARARGP